MWMIAGEAVISLLVLGGALFVLLGALGLAKLPDFYTRLHAPTKASTLGVGGMMLGSLLYFSSRDAGFSLHELLLLLFLFLTAPLTAHMLAKTALHAAATDSSDES
ncbi:MAG TPA: Na+/H+ antiporter subunit G [Spongiibacteraceae bacterium]|nr:Na+/H+ antiporter subunit G [Spongiibacteraceae bacterium]